MHYERRKTQRKAGKYYLRFEMHVFFFKLEYGFFAAEEEEHPYAGYTLGNNGGESGALNAHIKAEYEHRVEKYVGQSAYKYGVHAGLGEALSGYKGVHAKGKLHKYGACGVYVHVPYGEFYGVRACTKGEKQVPVPYQKRRGEYS